jgi:hypothetical protein
MEPNHDGDDEFIIHNIICAGTQHEGSFQEDASKDDSSQYLNDMDDGDADHLKRESGGSFCWPNTNILQHC